MTRARFDTREFERTFKNILDYSNGFLKGAEVNRKTFNDELGEYTTEALSKFIDSKARMSPDSLHHVYEWGQLGNSSARLFSISSQATKNSIILTGNFLSSSSISDTSSEPFVDKARVMENGIAIEITPKVSGVLAFEIDNDSVFSMDSIYIANPGGDEVAGSFGKAIEDFFENFFTNTVLFQSGIFEKLSRPKEYADNFPAGASGGGRGLGINSGTKYMSFRGAKSE
jgi:hypothetical protein